jgi:hypothetical protein
VAPPSPPGSTSVGVVMRNHLSGPGCGPSAATNASMSRTTKRRGLSFLAVAAAVASWLAGVGNAPAFGKPLRGASTPIQVSSCGDLNAEPELATRGRNVYEVWISLGCQEGIEQGTIGFARSTDAGRTFSPAFVVPGSSSSHTAAWDPAIAVGPTGIVYVSFMLFDIDTNISSPVVAASFDHGQTFPQVSALPVPPFTDPQGNWGDRDEIAVSPTGTVYVTWDYGPSYSEVQFLCAPTGSCSFTNGDFNAVIQRSTDRGKTWTSVRPITPGFPAGGAFGAPLVVQPNGTIDVLYLGHHTDPSTLALGPGGEYFTRSSDGGTTWSAPVQVGASAGQVALDEWWIDCNVSTDQSGVLYATWDTQTATSDIGWLAHSTDGGTTWSPPVRVTPDTGNSEQLMAAVGAKPGTAYVAWQTPADPQGYATFIRPYSITRGWLAPATKVSTQYGDPSQWPGDTIGIATIPEATASTRIGPPAIVSWGSAVGGAPAAQIFSSTITFGSTK